MKVQEWICVSIIVVGLASSAWQVHRIANGEHTKIPLFSVITNHININSPANLSSDCATRNLVFKAETIVLKLTTASVDTLNFIANGR